MYMCVTRTLSHAPCMNYVHTSAHTNQDTHVYIHICNIRLYMYIYIYVDEYIGMYAFSTHILSLAFALKVKAAREVAGCKMLTQTRTYFLVKFFPLL